MHDFIVELVDAGCRCILVEVGIPTDYISLIYARACATKSEPAAKKTILVLKERVKGRRRIFVREHKKGPQPLATPWPPIRGKDHQRSRL